MKGEAENPGKTTATTPLRLKKPDNKLAVLEQAQSLLQLEAEARRLRSRDGILFHLCNESRLVLKFDTAFVFLLKRKRLRISVASDTSFVEANAPMVRTLESVLSHAWKTPEMREPQVMSILGEQMQTRLKDTGLAPENLLWIPLLDRKGRLFGGMLAARQSAWPTRTVPLGLRISETYSHAINAVTGGKPVARYSIAKTLGLLAVPVAVACLVLIKVPLTVLAPVEVQGRDALFVTAPLDGVIEKIPFAPNSRVEVGDEIVIFKQTELENEVAVARESVLVAAAKLDQLTSGSFVDRDSRSQVPIAEAELALAKVRLAVAEERYGRSVILAKKDGVLIYESANELLGAPVSVGQRLITIVDPARVEYVVQIPVGDMIRLPQNAEAKIFMNHEPLASHAATIISIGHHAKLDEKGDLVYEAKLNAKDTVDRIGSRGVAQIGGENAPLYYTLFRRPLAWLRRNIGG